MPLDERGGGAARAGVEDRHVPEQRLQELARRCSSPPLFSDACAQAAR